MEINETDWQRVEAAFQLGVTEEARYFRALRNDVFDEAKVRAELRCLARSLEACSDETRELIEAVRVHSFGHSGGSPLVASHWLDTYVEMAQGIMVRRNRGKPVKHSHRTAVESLCQLWLGDRRAGAKINQSSKNFDYYSFNPFVRWLGDALLRLDPTLKTKNAACCAAWNALKANGKAMPKMRMGRWQARLYGEQACSSVFGSEVANGSDDQKVP